MSMETTVLLICTIICFIMTIISFIIDKTTPSETSMIEHSSDVFYRCFWDFVARISSMRYSKGMYSQWI